MSDIDVQEAAEDNASKAVGETAEDIDDTCVEKSTADDEAARKADEDRLREEELAREEAARKADEDRLRKEELAREEAVRKAEEDRLREEELSRQEAGRRSSQDSIATHDSPELLQAAEQRMRELLPQVKDLSILRELAELADSDALEKLVSRGKPPPKATFAARTSLKNNPFVADSAKKKDESQEAALDKSKNLGKISDASIAVGGAGAGGGLGLNRPGFGPKVQHFAGGRGSISQKAIEINADVSAAWQQMQDNDDPVGWVITTYSEDGKKLELKSKGEGGLNAFKAGLPENIAWGGFRCHGVDKRGGLVCKRPKFVFVQYKPEAASAIKKAKQASHKGDVKEIFPGAHLDIVVETMEDLAEETLIEKLQAATGAHKPNGYEFNNDGAFIEADYYGLGIGKSCKGETSVN